MTRRIFSWQNLCQLIDPLLFEPFCSALKYNICLMKPIFGLCIDLSGIINCNTFSVVPSIINEKSKTVLFHSNPAQKTGTRFLRNLVTITACSPFTNSVSMRFSKPISFLAPFCRILSCTFARSLP